MNSSSLKYDVVIIGGGASGLFCANMIKFKAPHLSVAVLEKQKTVGKKLLATGNGRCNLTNIFASIEMYHGTFLDGVSNLLNICPPDTVIGLFEDMGLVTTVDYEGRVYPLSKHSASVLDVLTLNCKNNNVDIITDFFVNDIMKKQSVYEIVSENQVIYANVVVIASGSKATPETGADDSILKILNKLGHRITPLTPALSPITVQSKSLYTIKGIRATGRVSILKDNKEIKSEYGEIQFTEKYLSGICIFNLARIANTIPDTYIKISLMPEKSDYELISILNNRKNVLKYYNPCSELLCGIFHQKLANVLIKEAGISKDKTIGNITDNDIKRLADIINNWLFPVIPSQDFKRAQIVSGGVHGKEIDINTMESKTTKNLYIIGEAVDCDGDCGGLNLQFAFASAYCAAMGITK